MAETEDREDREAQAEVAARREVAAQREAFLQELSAEVAHQLQASDFATHIAEQAAAMAIDALKEATQQRRAELADEIQKERTQPYPPSPNGHSQHQDESQSQIVIRTSQGKVDKGELLLDQVTKFLNDPLGNLTKLVDLWQKVKQPVLNPTNLAAVNIATIRAIATQKPDEFAFVAQQVLPDPMNDLIPQLTAEAYKRGFGSVVEANRWAREYVRDLSLAEKRSPASSKSIIPTAPSIEPIPALPQEPAAPLAPKPAEMRGSLRRTRDLL